MAPSTRARRRGVGQQRQALVAVAGQHHVVEAFAAVVGGHQHAGAARPAGWRRTLRTGVPARQSRNGPAACRRRREPPAHRVPLRPVGHLDQAVVVAEADHRGDGKAQHLVGRAGPDAADHRQEVPVAERAAEPVRGRGSRRWARPARLVARSASAVARRLKRTMSASMPRKRGAAGCGAGRTRCSGCSRSIPARVGHLHRERHVRRRGATPSSANSAPAAGRCAG
jgi:hypothetical protein